MKVFVVVLSLCIFVAVALAYNPARKNARSNYDKYDDDPKFLDLRSSILGFFRDQRKHRMEEKGLKNYSMVEGFDEDVERANRIAKQILKRRAVEKFFSDKDAGTGQGITISGSSATHKGHKHLDWRKVCCPELPCCKALPPL